MSTRNPQNIILIGFSTTGKSQVGRMAARTLGWGFVDTDDTIVQAAGKPIPHIFAEDSEEHFRGLERRALKDALSRGRQVVATGGGAVLDPANRELMAQNGLIVCLEAKPETIHQRLSVDIDSDNPVVRPLLTGPNPLERIRMLKEFRQPFYAVADWTIHTDTLSLEEVSDEVIRAWHQLSPRLRNAATDSLGAAHESDSPYCPHQGAAFVVATESATYPVYIGWGIRKELGQRLKEAGLAGTAVIVSDDTVFAIYGEEVEKALRAAGLEAHSITVPPGERSKTLESAARIYDALIERRIERGHAIVALGGGMVGDLAGFVAATYLRGVPLVQVPTSLLAMVDASIGGKVAVDHPQGKNLVGAFYQPSLVLMDVETLKTLPPRELTSGWAEVIKHGLILDKDFFDFLITNAPKLAALDKEATLEAVSRSTAIKAQVVSEDEREQGIRTFLNYGHTIGHALEAVTGYEGLLHGEAVAIGMMGAAFISRSLGLLPSEAVERQRQTLRAFGLPTSIDGIDTSALTRAMELDKKVRGKTIRWVLLTDIGRCTIRDDVPPKEVMAALEELTAS